MDGILLTFLILGWFSFFVSLIFLWQKQKSFSLQKQNLQKLELDLTQQKQEKLELEKLTARFEERQQHLQEQVKNHQEIKNELEKLAKVEFENMAQKILKTQSNDLRENSTREIGKIINPINEKLKDFEQKVNQYYGDEAKERFALKKEVQNIVMASQNVSGQAEKLANALKTDSGTQGRWGELVLEQILKSSGLRPGYEYTVQGKDLKLIDEEGKHKKPDVIVHLPEEKALIIDSKVSLKNYDDYLNATNEDQKLKALSRIGQSFQEHITNLSGKRYDQLKPLTSPECVLMFVPVEGAFALALQKHQGLMEFAWQKSIVIVSPSTLYATLRTVDFIWRQEKQNRNAFEIADRAGKLVDKFYGLIKDFDDLTKRIDQTQASCDKIKRKLSSGPGNLVGQIDKLKELGASASKAKPKELH